MASNKKVVDLGNGVTQVTYESGRRHYEVNGEKLPSVTTILSVLNKPALIYWAVNCYQEYLNQHSGSFAELLQAVEDGKKEFSNVSKFATDTGTMVHNAIELYLLTGELTELEGDAARGFNAYLEWEASHMVERVQVEVPIYSLKHGYAGTSDMICRLDGRDDLVLIDFKTSKDFYDEMFMQVAAYREAYNEMKNTVGFISASGILRLDKEMGTPTFNDCSLRSHDLDLRRFISLCEYKHSTAEADAFLKKAAKEAKAA